MGSSAGSGPIRRIVIVGGGTAGWFSAAFLSRLLESRTDGGCEICLIEASDIATVGVGEATIPPITQFFGRLGMPEPHLMLSCQASFKLAIKYAGWTPEGHDASFFHPFFIGGSSRLLDFSNLWLWQRLNDESVAAYAEACHVATHFAEQHRAPKLPSSPDYGGVVPYAYHLDAGLLADYLKLAFRDRIRHVVDKVTEVALREDGWIDHLKTESSGALEGDLFIDCSGFLSLLLDKALREPFVGYRDCLLNDRALAAQVPYLEGMRRAPYTTARAMQSGWSWDIPLFHRRGVGYVYSSDFVSDDRAEQEFRSHLGAAADGIELRRIRMRVGRHRRLWVNNCIGIGLAGGFIEPLESTGLDLIQKGLTTLLHCFPDRSFAPALADVYNATMTQYYDQIRDFIALHFCTTQRRDTAYWRACAHDLEPSDHLAHLLKVWKKASGKIYMTSVGSAGEYFGPLSYYCILIGMDYLPETAPPLYELADTTSLARDWQVELDKTKRYLDALPDHERYLNQLRAARPHAG